MFGDQSDQPQHEQAPAFVRYVVLPLAFATVVAVFAAGYVLFTEMTGYRGKSQPRATPVPFVEAWSEVPDFAGLIFVVSFLVFAIKARVWPGDEGDWWLAMRKAAKKR
jgi:hypothetical protein